MSLIIFKEQDRLIQLGYSLIRYDNKISSFYEHLSIEEKEIFDQFKVASRKESFLAGRKAARQAFLALNPEKETSELSIINGVWGFPLFRSRDNYLSQISIAHSTEHAAAIFAPFDTHPVGIDIEEMKDESLESLEKFFLKVPAPEINTENKKALFIKWTATEAVSKALRIGFFMPEETFAMSEIRQRENLFHIRFKTLTKIHALAWIKGNNAISIAYPSVWTFDKLSERGGLLIY